jgi:hypothetical protein
VTTTAAPVVAAEIPSRRRRMRAPVLVIGGLAVASLALRLRDPHEHGSWGLCPSAAMGVYCPGCGGLRAVNDLTHGDLGAAASSNLLFVVLLPFVVAGLGVWTVRRGRGDPRPVSAVITPPLVWASTVLIVVFSVLRNLPVGSWLAP